MDSKHRLRQCPDHEARETPNNDHNSSDFTSYLQCFLIKSGCPNDGETFMNFTHMALLNSCQKLEKLKSNVSNQLFNEEEYKYMNLLQSMKGTNEVESKLEVALKCFDQDVLKYIKRIMLSAGFDTLECDPSHDSFISFFSNLFLAESKRLLSHKSDRCPYQNHAYSSSKQKKGDTSIKNQIDHQIEDIKLSEYSMLLVKSTKKHSIYRVSSKSKTENKIFALKVLTANSPRTEDIENLINELKVANELCCQAFRQVYMKTAYQNKKSILLEYVNGYPLNQIENLHKNPNCMAISREIVSGLLAMHMNKLCHMDLTSEHIIYDPSSKSIKIIGCGSSTSFGSKRKYNQKLSDKDLRYISPEQTFRVNRIIDFRSDFYSLGVIFYRLFTGKYPFESKNAFRLINMHITMNPSPLQSVDANIPITMSDLIMKLLSKEADGRYQSAKGIMHDIDLIMSENGPDAPTITLGQHDTSEIFIVPQKIYGRSNEYNKMLSILDRIKTTHCFESLFIKGRSGRGKSVLVSELYKSVVTSGYFICGKYDISKSAPCVGILEAMNIFCEDILLEDEETIAKYRVLIQNAVGEEGKILTDAIANLHIIIGEQPAISNTYGVEAKNRFNYVFIKFIEAICSVKCPLVLVLDDLQWLDVASLCLLRSLVKKSIKNLMLIGIYRDNEVIDTHPLVQLFDDVKSINANYTEMTLLEMNHETTNDLISDSLRISSLSSYPLSSFVYTKTKGSVFFAKQMLHSFVEQNLITPNIEERCWQWDDQIFAGRDVAEDIHDLLRRKLLSYSEHTQQAFTIASILGSPFSMSTLKYVISQSEAVDTAISSGLINQVKGCNDAYCFAHDQVQHAAYSLLPENSPPIFLYVGKKILINQTRETLNENIFVIVNLLYHAIDIIDDHNERNDVANLFKVAGDNAMASTAFDQAFKYMLGGIKLLSKDCWKDQYKLSLSLHCSAAKAAYCVAKYPFCLKFIEKIFSNVSNDLDLVNPNLLLIRMYNDKRMNDDAIDTAASILEKLGERITINQNEMDTLAIVQQTKTLLGTLSSDDILKMKPIEDKRLLSIMEILHTILLSCYFSNNPSLLTHISARMVQLTFLNGMSKYACLSICGFATALSGMRDKLCYNYGRLSMDLVEKINLKELIPLVKSTFYGNINPFFGNIHHSTKPMMSMTFICLETGSHSFSIACAGTYAMLAFVCGTSLTSLIDTIDQLERVLPMQTALFSSIHQATINLIDETYDPTTLLCGEKFDCKNWFDEDRQQSDVARVSALCCCVSYLYNDYDRAASFIEICRPLIKSISSLYLSPLFYFYDGLVSLSFARNGKDEERHTKNAEDNIMKLKRLCDNAPQNYQNFVCLLQAELAAVKGNRQYAISQYEEAISLSSVHGFINEEALSCERAGIYYLQIKSHATAKSYLTRSLQKYLAWGATSKAQQLRATYPCISSEEPDDSSISVENHREEIRVDSGLLDNVSLMTDDTSVKSIYTRRDTKRARL